MLNKLFFVLLLLIFTSCKTEEYTSFSVNGGNKINSYSSPSAYYGKPISRMYVNPYEIYPEDARDNDNLYVAPQSYGSTP